MAHPSGAPLHPAERLDSCWVVSCEDEFQRRVHPSYLVHIFILLWSLSILAAEDVLCAWVRRGG